MNKGHEVFCIVFSILNVACGVNSFDSVLPFPCFYLTIQPPESHLMRNMLCILPRI